MRYLEKLLILHKVWSKVLKVAETESMNGFSKSSKRSSSFEKRLRKRYFVKVLIFRIVWSKVLKVAETESMNGFSKSSKRSSSLEKKIKEALFCESINISYSLIKGFRRRRIWIYEWFFEIFKKNFIVPKKNV